MTVKLIKTATQFLRLALLDVERFGAWLVNADEPRLLTLSFSAAAADLLDELMHLTGAASKAKILYHALRLLDQQLESGTAITYRPDPSHPPDPDNTPAPDEARVEICFEFTDESWFALEELRIRLGAHTLSETVRMALAVYADYVMCDENGIRHETRP